jgi:hypothetical protein
MSTLLFNSLLCLVTERRNSSVNICITFEMSHCRIWTLIPAKPVITTGFSSSLAHVCHKHFMSCLNSSFSTMSSVRAVHIFMYPAYNLFQYSLNNSKAIPVTGLGGLCGCEMLRVPHCLDNRLTVNCEILATCSSTYSPVRTSQEAHSVSVK